MTDRAGPDGRSAGVGGHEVALARRDGSDGSGRFSPVATRFRDLCEDLVIRLDDFASDEVLNHMEIDDPFDLLGLFQGVGLPFRYESAPMQMPNLIWLYRRPILDYWADHDETLGAIVAHVLVHEIGHHFGLSDDDIEAIERAAG